MYLHYAENNVGQCWNCKNNISRKLFPSSSIKNENGRRVFVLDNNCKFWLPECQKLDTYVTYVNEKCCPAWEKKE